jgi:protein TonB
LTEYAKLLACGVISLGAHFVMEQGLQALPPWSESHPPQKLEVRLVAPPETLPEPEPVKPIEPPPKLVEPPKVVHEAPRPHPAKITQQAEVPKEAPPVEHPPTTPTTTGTDGPVFNGGTMESTSQGGNGPAIPIGRPGGAGGQAPVANPPAGHDKNPGEPVAAYEVTKMPLPQGRCEGKLPEDARQAGFEGTVVLELVVAADGSARNIKVVKGLGHGLTEAAIAALQACHFSPGEKDGHAVPVRVRDFKVRFVLPDT